MALTNADKIRLSQSQQSGLRQATEQYKRGAQADNERQMVQAMLAARSIRQRGYEGKMGPAPDRERILAQLRRRQVKPPAKAAATNLLQVRTTKGV